MRPAPRPELLGVAVDEDTALVVTGTESQVIGTHYVAFYVSEEWKAARGATPWSGRDFILLKAGDTFSLSERQPGLHERPARRPVPSVWQSYRSLSVPTPAD